MATDPILVDLDGNSKLPRLASSKHERDSSIDRDPYIDTDKDLFDNKSRRKRGRMNDDSDDLSWIGSSEPDTSSDFDLLDMKHLGDDLGTLSPQQYASNDIADAFNDLQNSIVSLNEDTVSLHDTVATLHNKVAEQQKQIEVLQRLVTDSIEVNKAFQSHNRMLQEEVEMLRREKLENPSYLSTNGSYIWKITDFTKKLADALSEIQTSIYSPPFYSSPTGYKMCMRLYLQGDGQARKTHLSLFFVILRGEYDALLPWPFDHRVTFCLFDQTKNQRHFIDSFRPDPKSNSFQRPRSNMNIASGIPKFCPLTIVQQNNNPYVRDDCMFIQCTVDFKSMPKSVLPIACTMNLALPPALREEKIREEIAKANQTTTEKTNDDVYSSSSSDSPITVCKS